MLSRKAKKQLAEAEILVYGVLQSENPSKSETDALYGILMALQELEN